MASSLAFSWVFNFPQLLELVARSEQDDFHVSLGLSHDSRNLLDREVVNVLEVQRLAKIGFQFFGSLPDPVLLVLARGFDVRRVGRFDDIVPDGFRGFAIAKMIIRSPPSDGVEPSGKGVLAVVAVKVSEGLDKRILSQVFGILAASSVAKEEVTQLVLMFFHKVCETGTVDPIPCRQGLRGFNVCGGACHGLIE